MTTKTTKNERVIVEEKTIYISADGKEWESEQDCLEWEKGVECVATEGWNRIKKLQINTVSMGLGYSNDDEEAYIVLPNSHEDIVCLENYVRIYTGEGYGFDDSLIGVPIIVNFGYDHDWCSVLKVKEHINVIQEYADFVMNHLNQ